MAERTPEKREVAGSTPAPATTPTEAVLLPNFFLVGAQKAGTSSLHRYLGQHPAVHMSTPKEPRWFDAPEAEYTDPTRGASYEALFAAPDAVIRGESSVAYLTSPVAPGRIAEAVPDARCLAVLRDPVSRARSAHAMWVRSGHEPITDFAAAIDAALAGRTERDYLGFGTYAPGLRRYRSLLGPDQVHLGFYEDYSTDPDGFVREVFTWLGLDPTVPLDTSARSNVGRVPRSADLLRLTTTPNRVRGAARRLLPRGLRVRLMATSRAWNDRSPRPVPERTRRLLVEHHAADIGAVEALTGRDLSAWR